MTLREEVTLAPAGAPPARHRQPARATRRSPRSCCATTSSGAGSRCELVGRSPDRLNLVARLPGGDGPSLALLAHTDTVRADAEEWSRDPWSGDLVDGEIWGRGALDMKSQVAASAVAFASLVREGFRPPGDLILALTADEEVNDDYGLSWLVREHPELVRADYSLNEGGGRALRLRRQGRSTSAPSARR